jgi:hypothetical protein
MGKIDMKDWWIYLTLGAAILLPLIGLEIIDECCGLTPVCLPPPPSPLSPEETEVKEVILEAYSQMGFKGLTFDTSRLDEFFIDDPRFPLRRELRKEVELAFGEVSEGAGYLTYVRAWYKNWEKRGTPTLKKIWQEAIGARRRLNGSSLAICRLVEIVCEKLERQPGVKSLEAQLGYFPVFRSPMENEGIPEDWMERFHFFEFEIDEDKAMCLYSDWGTLRRAYLVNKGGKWYIADNILLEVYL